ncbi:MAG TPA: PadR family transcriptional regulator [Solirubrobacterales bacterium]
MKSKAVKLTTTSYAVLAVLDQIGEATSYDLKQSIEKSIQNFWPVPHTTAYEEPARLADSGYLSVSQEKGGRRRKTYAMTDRGREALRAWAEDPGIAAPQLRDEMVLKVFAGGDPGGMVDERTAWHHAKLEELNGLLEGVRGVEGYERSELTLLAGLSYHRRMLQMLEDLS